MNSFDLLKQKELFVMYTMEDSKVVTKRFEDFSRLYDKIIVFKGSFNPFHKGHEEILERTMKASDDSGVVTMSLLVISRDTFGKGIVENLEERIAKLCEKGFVVLIVETPWFYDSLKLIRDRYKGSIEACMGLDTFSRLYKCYEEGNLSDLECKLSGKSVYYHDDRLETNQITFKIFVEIFKDLKVNFSIYDRPNNEFDKDLFKDHEDLVKFHHMDNPISSTEIRMGIV
jgi:glycerol-3-phosphate cytidylyltransferase-like family protein